MRHKDVTQCSIGAFGFYLLFRFHKSGEMDDGKRPNFAENDEWFHIKILTDGTVTDTKKELLKRSYTDPIRKVFKKLGIYSFHFGHWGRVNAPAKLEFEELHPEFIRILGKSLRLFDCRFHFVHSLISFFIYTGNWDTKTQEARYSAKIPTVALRVIAGYEQTERYSLPRCRLVPPESLQSQIFPFIEEEMENVRAYEDRKKTSKPTAVTVLKLWKKLRIVILQDAAELWLKFPARKQHPLFKLPVFRCPEFHVSAFVCCLFRLIVVSNSLLFRLSQSYVESMKEMLATVEEDVDRSLEAIAPDIQRQFNELHGEVKRGNETVVGKLTEMNRKLDESMDSRPTRTELAAGFADIAVRMAGRPTTATVTTTRTTTTTTTTSPPMEEVDDHGGQHGADWEAASSHSIRIRDIDCVDEVYMEFKGRGISQDQPIIGGMEACEARWKTKWRRHFSSADQKRFSRYSQLTKAIDDQVEKGKSLRDVMATFDHYYRATNKRSFCALITKLQDEGYIEKKAARTKKRVRTESPGEGGGGG
jgi:hypothetical protein